MSYSHTSSITIPISSSIHPAPIFPQALQELQQSGPWGRPHYTSNSPKKSQSVDGFDKSSSQQCTQ